MRRAQAGPRSKHAEAALSRQASQGRKGGFAPLPPEEAAQPEGQTNGWTDSRVSGALPNTPDCQAPAPLLPGHTELRQAPGPPPPRCMLGFGFCAAADPTKG